MAHVQGWIKNAVEVTAQVVMRNGGILTDTERVTLVQFLSDKPDATYQEYLDARER